MVILSANVSFSQTVNGTLLGAITDSSGASVPNAQVQLKEANTGLAREMHTSDAGTYVFANLPQGTYSVSVEVQGFKKGLREKVDVLVNTTVRVDLTLQPGNVTEVVMVTAEVPLLQTDRSDTGTKIEEKTLANLPVSTRGGRNFQSLLNFVPGATRVTFEHSEFFNAASTLQTRVNGQGRMANNLQFEGVDNNERTGLLQVLIPPIEALQTVDISTSNYEAELGRATGAVTNIVLKSGTNQLHAQGYWFNRVSALSARPFYDPARANFVYNYFGGQAGGPIVKNRTFFFFDFLRQTDHRYSNDRYTIPTLDERAGDLSVSPSVIYDPATGNADGTNRTPFTDKRIPLSRIGAIQGKILALIPAPNQPGLNQNYFTQIPFVRNTNQFDIKGDHQQGVSNRFSVRYSRSVPTTYDGPAYGAAGGPHGGGFQGTGTQATHNGAINYNHFFSPTLVTEVRAGVSRYRNDAQQVDYGTNASDAIGVPGVNTGDPFVSGLVSMEVDNFTNPIVGYSASLPWVRAETNIDLVNTWTKTLSRHTVKWGADLRRIRDELLQAQTFNPRGVYRYGVNQTSIPGAATSFGNSFASFLLDSPRQTGRDLPLTFPTFRAWQLFTFVQDKWQVSQKLTVDFGLRWEFYPPAVSSHERAGFSNYDPTNNTLVLTGVGGNPQNMGMQTNYKDFGPRAGIAYRLNDRTVLRAGYGISFTPFPDNQYGWNNFPVTQNNNYNPLFTYAVAVLPNNQPATLARGFPAPTPAVIPESGIITNAPDQVYNVMNKQFREPYVQSWNFAVQRALPRKFALDVAYVGNHGVAQPTNYNLNAATVVGLDVQGQPLVPRFNRRSTTNLRYQGFSSSYNSMQVKIDRRFSGGFLAGGHYTWSKALGYTPRYYINTGRNWAPLDFDRRQNFALAYVYELPFGKGKRWMNSNPVGAA
ncbi:MAG: carboxypeptidase regulatory-like domain-containing protein, partial [Bryobacteraceae bacterium]